MLRGFWKWFNNVRAIVLAVVVHIIVLGILIVNMEWLDVKPAASPKSAPIQTQTVDRALIEKELARIEQEKKRKLEEEKRKQQQIEKEKRRLAELEKQRKVEEKRKLELAEKQKRDAKRKKEAELKRQKELVAKKQREAEAKKKAQAEALKKKQLAAEAKKKRMAEEQRRQKEMEEALLQAMEDEENESKLAQLKGQVRTDIQNNYYIPPTARKGMQCVMLIRLLPSGDVQSVKITQSSGDAVFDKAAEDAVYRASPLPVSVSSAGKLFSEFREFNFRFKPDL